VFGTTPTQRESSLRYAFYVCHHNSISFTIITAAAHDGNTSQQAKHYPSPKKQYSTFRRLFSIFLLAAGNSHEVHGRHTIPQEAQSRTLGTQRRRTRCPKTRRLVTSSARIYSYVHGPFLLEMVYCGLGQLTQSFPHILSHA
jgi:hypothetical protein